MQNGWVLHSAPALANKWGKKHNLQSGYCWNSTSAHYYYDDEDDIVVRQSVPNYDYRSIAAFFSNRVLFFLLPKSCISPFLLHKQLDAPPGRGKMLILCVNINVYGLPSAGCPFLSFTTSKSTVCHHWGPSRRIQYFPRRINWGWGWRGGAGKKRSGCHGWYEGNFR